MLLGTFAPLIWFGAETTPTRFGTQAPSMWLGRVAVMVRFGIRALRMVSSIAMKPDVVAS